MLMFRPKLFISIQYPVFFFLNMHNTDENLSPLVATSTHSLSLSHAPCRLSGCALLPLPTMAVPWLISLDSVLQFNKWRIEFFPLCLVELYPAFSGENMGSKTRASSKSLGGGVKKETRKLHTHSATGNILEEDTFSFLVPHLTLSQSHSFNQMALN